MKTNAIIRIVVWSLVLVLLVGLLAAGLLYRDRRVSSEAPLETVLPADEAPVLPVEDYPITCDTTVTVTANAVNVRILPSSDSDIVGMVEKGATLSVNRGVSVSDTLWIGIYAPVNGWLKAEYVDSIEEVTFHSDPDLRSGIVNGGNAPSEEGTIATVTAELNVRSAPSPDASINGLLQPGDTVTVTRQENVNGEAWAFITSPSSGWVQAKYLTENTPSSASSDQQFTFDPRQIREIDIEWALGSIIIEPAEVDSIQISEAASSESAYPMVWKQNNNKLTIRFSEKNNFSFGINLGQEDSKNLCILVPIGWECDALEIDAASATVDVKNLTIREVDFDGASGNCNFAGCVIDELDIDTASGDIYFNGTLNSLDCDAASASVYAVFDNVPSRIEMDSMSGDLDISLPSTAGFTVSMEALTSDFVCEFGYAQEKDRTYRRGDGKCRITLNAMSGDLYIRKNKEPDSVPEST